MMAPRTGPSAEAAPAVVLPSGLSQSEITAMRNLFDRSMAEVAAQAKMREEDIERVTSAWSMKANFVSRMLSIAAPRIRSRLLEQGKPWTDIGEHVDATLLVASHLRAEPTHAHQDIAYKWNRPVDARYAYTTWLALDACGPDSGALTFGRAFPPLPIVARQDFLCEEFVDHSTTPTWRDAQFVAAVEPGDIVVFDACAWHASSAFREPGRRLALAIRWASKSGWERAVSLPNPTIRPVSFGMDTSGALLCGVVRATCGRLAVESARGGTYATVTKLFQHHHQVVERLSAPAKRSLEDLILALALEERHGGRCAPGVWRAVRDHALPELVRLGEVEGNRELA